MLDDGPHHGSGHCFTLADERSRRIHRTVDGVAGRVRSPDECTGRSTTWQAEGAVQTQVPVRKQRTTDGGTGTQGEFADDLPGTYTY